MKEILIPDNEIIVSKTDTQSHITYGNKLFITISGYTEKELLGKPHNIIRHPDMPKAVYKLLWDTIKSKREFFGLVKNKCKNGDFYWAFANITPSYNERLEVIGYYSVRRKPSQNQISTICPLYEEMLAIEKRHGTSQEGTMQLSKQFLLDHTQKLGEDYDDALLKLYY